MYQGAENMFDAIVAFVITLGCLFGFISMYYLLFMSCVQKNCRSVICISGNAQNAEQIIRAAVFTDRMLQRRLCTVILDCGVDENTAYIIENLSKQLNFEFLSSDKACELFKK